MILFIFILFKKKKKKIVSYALWASTRLYEHTSTILSALPSPNKYLALAILDLAIVGSYLAPRLQNQHFSKYDAPEAAKALPTTQRCVVHPVPQPTVPLTTSSAAPHATHMHTALVG